VYFKQDALEVQTIQKDGRTRWNAANYYTVISSITGISVKKLPVPEC